MLHNQRILEKSVRYVLTLGLALGATACDGDDDTNDAGPAARDAGFRDSTVINRDSGPRADAGFNPDATPRDAGHYCAAAGSVDVDGTAVPVDNASAIPAIATGEATISCFDGAQPPVQDQPITFRGCLTLVGGSTTASDAELDELDISVFLAKDAMGDEVDPTFDPTDWSNKATAATTVGTDVVLLRNNSTCRGGTLIELGRASLGSAALKTSISYTIRVRSKATGGPWAATYHHNAIVFPDRLEVGGGFGRCTPQDCVGRYNMVAVRKSAATDFATAAGANPMGNGDLDDMVGDGYALIEAWDCTKTPMSNATGGFVPAPAAAGYLADGAFSTTAGGTDISGLYAGVGFTNTSSTAPLEVTAAVGITTDGTCTEEYSGAAFKVYPDSVTVYRAGRAHLLHF